MLFSFIFYVYKIENNVNGKFYVGRTSNLFKRFNRHRNDLNQNKHHNIYLQRSWNKYGEENFIFSVIEELSTLEDSIEKEKYFLDNFKSNLYNLSQNASFGGDNLSYHPDLDKIKVKISKSILSMYGNKSDVEI